MPSEYNLSLPTLTKDDKEAHVGHKHLEYGYTSQKASISGCIAFFKATLENKDLDPELQRAAKCAVAEDEARIELILQCDRENEELRSERKSAEKAEKAEKEKRSRCVML
jgi:hypothetical protein